MIAIKYPNSITKYALHTDISITKLLSSEKNHHAEFIISGVTPRSFFQIGDHD